MYNKYGRLYMLNWTVDGVWQLWSCTAHSCRVKSVCIRSNNRMQRMQIFFCLPSSAHGGGCLHVLTGAMPGCLLPHSTYSEMSCLPTHRPAVLLCGVLCPTVLDVLPPHHTHTHTTGGSGQKLLRACCLPLTSPRRSAARLRCRRTAGRRCCVWSTSQTLMAACRAPRSRKYIRTPIWGLTPPPRCRSLLSFASVATVAALQQPSSQREVWCSFQKAAAFFFTPDDRGGVLVGSRTRPLGLLALLRVFACRSLFPGIGPDGSLPQDPQDLPFTLAVAVNKFDLLPQQATTQRVQQWVRSRCV